MKNAKYKTEFPSFGELDVTIPAGFEDTSLANHTHPTFTSDALRLEIWIDYADKGDREPLNVERPRFHVYRIDDEGCVTSDALVASNDWSDVEVFVAEAVPFYVPNGRYLAAGLEDWQTGGGCTAWGGNLRVSDKRESDQPSGSFIWKNFRESDDFRPYVMVTDSEGGVIPEDPSARVTVGLYLSEESEGDACFEFPSTDEAIAFLRTLPFTTERSDDPGRPKSNAETLEATGIPAVLDRMRAGTFDAGYNEAKKDVHERLEGFFKGEPWETSS